MDEYTDWTVGEIIDTMIRLRTKDNLSFAEKKEYNSLVTELDRRFAILMPEQAQDPVAAKEAEPESVESESAEPEAAAESAAADDEGE